MNSTLGFMTICFAVVFLLLPDTAHAISPQGINVQGRLVKPDGMSVESATVEFQLQVRSSGAESCVLYEETHTVNMLGSDGVFNIKLGSGVRTGSAHEDTSPLKDAFNNSLGAIGSLSCASGTSYDPGAGDVRKLRVSFDDGAGVQTLTQDLTVQSVPFALYADTLQGKAAGDFVQTVSALEATPGTSQSRVNRLIDTDWAGLDALLLGTSTLYAKSAPTAAVSNNNQRLINVADPTSAQDAATKNYADTKIGGATADTATIGVLAAGDAGKALTWDGAKWVATTPAGTDNTKVAKAGDTMTGVLNLPANGLVVGTNQLVATGGGVGIGTTTPVANLDVSGGAIAAGGVYDLGAFYDIAPQGTVTVVGGSLSNGGPQYRGRFSQWTVPNTGGTLTLTLPSSNPDVSAISLASDLTTYSLKKFTVETSTAAGCASSYTTVATEDADGTKAFFLYRFTERSVRCVRITVTETGTGGSNVGNLRVYRRSGAGGGSNNMWTMVGQHVVLGTTGGYVGVGTTSPLGGFELVNEGTSDAKDDMRVTTYGTTTTPSMLTARARGTLAAPTGVLANDILGSFIAFGHNGTSFRSGITISGVAETNYTSTASTQNASMTLNTTLAGTSTEKARLTSAGNFGIGVTAPDRLLHVNGPMRLNAAALPTTPLIGDIAIDSGDANKLKWYNGTAWQTVGTGTGTGTISALSGDVVASGTGSVTAEIQAGVVGTTELADDAATFAKIQNITSARLLGRTTAAAGDIEQLTVGTGLTLASGSLSANIGQVAGSMMGADAVPNCTSAQKLQMSLGPTFAWSCVTDQISDSSKVDKAGDTMTGTLVLPTNGLTAGTNQLVLSGGFVGVGTASPSVKVDVRGGAIRSVSSTGASHANAAASVDWSRGNNQSMSVACDTTAFTNLEDGGTYTLAVTETSATMCVFSQAGLTYYYSPANGVRVNGLPTVYSFTRVGSNVYVSWSVMNP